MVAEELIVKIRAEVDKAVREMQRAEKQGKKSETSFRKMAAAMGVGNIASQAFTRGLSAVKNLISESARAASDAEETFAKFNTVFQSLGRDAPDAMYALADSFNLADSTAARLLGNTGDLLTGFGLTQEAALELSDETTRLAIDLASFTNAQGGAEAVSRALTAAYAGERESLKTYGIVMTEADVQARTLKNEMEGLTFESDRQARAFATLQLAQEQSKNAIGDYERTAESTANTQREFNETLLQFKENLGDSINEGVTPLRRALIGLFEDINTQTEGQTLFDQLVGDPGSRSIDQIERAQELIRESIDLEARRGGAAAGRQMSQLQEQLNTLDDMLETEENRADSMEYVNGLIERGARVRQQAAEAAEREAEAQARLALLQERWAEDRATLESVYSQTLQGQREELQKTIALFEGMVAQSDPVRNQLAVAIRFLKDELEELNEIPSFGFEAPTFQEGGLLGEMPEKMSQFEMFAKTIRENAEDIQSTIGNINTAFNAGMGAIDAWSHAFDSGLKSNIENLEAVMEKMGERQERELAFAEAAGASEEELTELRQRQREEQKAAEEELEAKKRELAKKEFARQKALNIANATMDTAAAVAQALPNLPLAAFVGVLGAAQIAGIAAQPAPAFEKGGSFVTSGPQMIQVGDGQSPRERVTVEPLSGPYRGSSGGITINISGVIGDRERVAEWVNEGIRRGRQRGAIRG